MNWFTAHLRALWSARRRAVGVDCGAVWGRTRIGRTHAITAAGVARAVVADVADEAQVDALVRDAHGDGGRLDVLVHSVCPGMIATEGTLAAFSDPRARTALQRAIPAGRFGRPEEVAAAAFFLASDHAEYVRGATLVVDGGQTASLGALPLGNHTDAR